MLLIICYFVTLGLSISSLFPFLYFMVRLHQLRKKIHSTLSFYPTFSITIHSVDLFSKQIRDFHIAKTVEDIGFYAGFVGKNLQNY